MERLKRFLRSRVFWMLLGYAASSTMQATGVPEPIAQAVKTAISVTAGEIAKD